MTWPTFWDIARPTLGRVLLGKLIREHGEHRVEAAIIETIRKRPADPKTYLLGILKGEADKTLTPYAIRCMSDAKKVATAHRLGVKTKGKDHKALERDLIAASRGR